MEQRLGICFMLLMSVTIPAGSQDPFLLPMTIPWSDGIKSNEYQCTGVTVPQNSTYIVRYNPMMNTSLVHHMLLYGCKSPYSTSNTWDCKGMGQLCSGHSQPYILFGWGRNASGIQLPQGVGFKVRGNSNIDWFVLQLHYGDLPDNKDHLTGSENGLTIQLTSNSRQSLAGIYLLAAYAFKSIPPTTNVVNLDLACQYFGNTIVPFAYRVHAHSLGIKITGYVVKNNGADWVELGSRSPQDPQAFYPVINNVTINTGDYLAARCIYSSVGINSITNIGADTSDEMCNFYFMYYTDNNPSAASFGVCSDPAHVHGNLDNLEFPEQDEYQCPDIVPPIACQRKEGALFVDQQWTLNNVVGSEALPLLGVALGQVTAVQARNGYVYVLHRGVVKWDTQSFNQSNYYMNIAAGPIEQSTVLELNSTGHLISQWGKNMFYMPHGLTIDSQGNYWITDVAMHQVFKFTPQRKKALELGVAFSPGNDHNHFCKPASVAVDTETGVVYVADGYCNSRVILFSPTGQYLTEQNAAVNNLGMRIVHKLVIVEKLDQLLVADRENGRVLAYRLHDMGFLWSMILPDLGGTVYSIDVNSTGTLQMFAVGRNSDNGITVDQSGAVLGKWSPPHVKLLNPHDVSMDTDGSAVYVTEIGPNRVWRFVRKATNETSDDTMSSTTSADDTRLSTSPSSVYITTSPTSSSWYTTKTSLVYSAPSHYSTPLQLSSSLFTQQASSTDSQSHSASTDSQSHSSSTDSQSHLSSTDSQSHLSSTDSQSHSSSTDSQSHSSFTDSQSHFTIISTAITSTVSPFATLPAFSQSHHSIQTSSVSVVSTSVTSLSYTTSSTSTASSNASTDPHRSSDTAALQAVAIVLTGLVTLVALLAIILTVRYCSYSSNLQPQSLRMKLFPTNGHHGFSKLRTFDPDASDDELTVFTKF